jgi:hypothetical protein
MSDRVPPVSQPNLRGTDSNSLLRMYDQASEAMVHSVSQEDRVRAEKAKRRIVKELQKRNVAL